MKNLLQTGLNNLVVLIIGDLNTEITGVDKTGMQDPSNPPAIIGVHKNLVKTEVRRNHVKTDLFRNHVKTEAHKNHVKTGVRKSHVKTAIHKINAHLNRKVTGCSIHKLITAIHSNVTQGIFSVRRVSDSM
jgi:hypothetical protein